MHNTRKPDSSMINSTDEIVTFKIENIEILFFWIWIKLEWFNEKFLKLLLLMILKD